MKNHKELAKAYFLEGYNCSQSVLLAFHEELGLDKDTAAWRRNGAPKRSLRHSQRNVSSPWIKEGI